jgi:alpha-glucosidase
MGEYIVTARQAGANWYVGALTNWTGRTIELPLTFLDSGAEYTATILCDGANADKKATDYKIETGAVRHGDTITLKMASGGGAAIKLIRK